MSICFDEAKGLLTLETLSTSYQMKIDRAGYLEHLYYGARIHGADMSYMLRHYDRGFSGNPYAERHDRSFSLDTLGQEYSSFGVGDYRVHSIGAVNPDGSRCAEFHYVSHEIRPGKYALPGLPAAYDNGGEAESLIVTLRDRVTGLGLRLYYGVFEKLDVITRAAELFSDGDSAFVPSTAATAWSGSRNAARSTMAHGSSALSAACRATTRTPSSFSATVTPPRITASAAG